MARDRAAHRSPSRSPSVLLVGAFERDNFGDLLFLHQTEHYLRSARLELAAPFPGLTSERIPRAVPTYARLIRHHPFDHIWTVGGEVGGVSVDSAALMSAPTEASIAHTGSPEDAVRALEELTGLDPRDGAYLVNPRLLHPLSRASLHVNSVGLAGLAALNARRRWRLLRSLYASRHVSVRDFASSRVLTGFGIRHTLAPDLVHTIALTRPRASGHQPDLALFQMSEALLGDHDPARIADVIASSIPRHMRIEFFVAGTAPHHDSVIRYERVRSRLQAVNPGIDVAIPAAGSALDRTDRIARSGLWIGSSLHGRVVSCAYDIPRVSLDVNKVTSYARTWDPDMPFGVTLDQLPRAVDRALQQAARSAPVGTDLAILAERNIEAMSADLFGGPRLGRCRTPTRPRSALRLAARATRDMPSVLRNRVRPLFPTDRP